jgi:plasmid stabilization system protein ParE
MTLLHLHDEVEADVDKIWNRIALNDPTVADRFVDAVEATFAQIGRHPAIGHRRRWRSRKLADVRIWRVGSFPNHLVSTGKKRVSSPSSRSYRAIGVLNES